MSHIVLAVDDDEARAEKSAEGIVDLGWDIDSLTVTVLHVFDKNPEGASVTQISAARVAHDILEAAGIDVELDEVSGDPTDHIIKYARTHDADAIAIAGRKRTPAGKAIFGSVSQSVMLESTIPVLFCPSPTGK